MGYTHYWRRDRAFTKAEWQKIAADISEILKTTKVPLDDPEIMPDHILFNGVGEDSHETFYVMRLKESFNFCKTAHKPYDTVVVACLIYLATVGVKVESDGGAEDWEAGLALAREALPDHAMSNPIKED